MSYKILLFDLDDTLLDFSANEAVVLEELFRLRGYAFTDETRRIYNSVNKRLWTDYENGVIPLDTVLNTRFSEALQKMGHTVDGVEWEKQYRELLGGGTQLMDGALELCRELSASLRLFVITNGVTETQIKRLKRSGLYKYFEEVFTSQSIGFQKPAKEFFDYVAGNIKDFDKNDALIIGDYLNTDIKGGITYGIDTCWLNAKKQSPNPEIQATYTISSLTELYGVCGLAQTV